MVEAARGSLVLASTLAIGQWFRFQEELWLVVWNEPKNCLRFGPSGFTGSGTIGNGKGGSIVVLEQPWLDVVGRLQPVRLGELPIGSWYDWAGQPALVVGGEGELLIFDPLQWCELRKTEIVVPLEVQIRTDRKPLARRIADWWRRR